jgi:hypothetical protein
MRIIPAILAAALAAACNAANGAPTAQPPRGAPSAAASSLRGKVLERIDAGSYSYLRIASPSGEVWAAVPVTPVATGIDVEVEAPLWMDGFESKTLKRRWDRIAFGTLSDGAPAAAGARIAPAPAARPFSHPAAAPAAEVGPVRVERATGANGRTVGEIYAQRGSLSGREVAVRGKVVKFTAGVLGRNWIHLRDGTGAADTSDLTVTSAQDCKPGDVVLARGIASVDRDFGAGYRYPVIVEEARLEVR